MALFAANVTGSLFYGHCFFFTVGFTVDESGVGGERPTVLSRGLRAIFKPLGMLNGFLEGTRDVLGNVTTGRPADFADKTSA